jgi:hypothetical protein
MQSLARLRAKINDLLTKRAAIAAQPLVTCYLPDNGRGPACDDPHPRVVEIGPNVRIISYLPGSPPPELAGTQAGPSVDGDARP